MLEKVRHYWWKFHLGDVEAEEVAKLPKEVQMLAAELIDRGVDHAWIALILHKPEPLRSRLVAACRQNPDTRGGFLTLREDAVRLITHKNRMLIQAQQLAAMVDDAEGEQRDRLEAQQRAHDVRLKETELLLEEEKNFLREIEFEYTRWKEHIENLKGDEANQ